MDHAHTPRNPVTLFFGITGLILLAEYVNVFPPATAITIVGFFVLLIATLMVLGIYALRNMRRVVMITMAIVIYLSLRFVGLRHPLYAVLLAASIVALEYVWKDNK